MPRRMLLLVAVGEVLGMTLWFSATAAAPSMALEFGLDAAGRSWLTMAVQAGFVAGTLVTALTNVADAINARRLFAAGCAIGAASNAAIAIVPAAASIVPGAAAIVALRFCTGAALAWVYPPGMKIAASWFIERRGTALGIVVGAVGLGSAMPHLLAWLGAGLPWRALVLASSALALGGGAVVALAVHDGPYVAASAPFDRHALRVVLRSRGTRLAMLGYLGHMWELYAMWTWMAAFASASLAAAAAASLPGAGPRGSAIAFLTLASGAIGCVIAGRWADAWGRARVAGAAMLASAVCALASPFVYGLPLAALVPFAVVWGCTAVADSAQFSALVTEYTARTHVGTALALQTSAGFLLTIVSIQLVPPIGAAVGWKWAFLFLAPGPLLGAAAMRRLAIAPASTESLSRRV